MHFSVIRCDQDSLGVEEVGRRGDREREKNRSDLTTFDFIMLGFLKNW